MRIIPVIDLLNGHAVHAVKGERKQYKPLGSILCSGSDPFSVAQAFRDTLGLNELYIADLDAIQSSGAATHRKVIGTLIRSENLTIILDAGTPDAGSMRPWLDCGVHKIIVGSETLIDLSSLTEIPGSVDPAQVVFSLDVRSGVVLSRCPSLAAMPPMKVLKLLFDTGWHEVILLDLCRVGSGCGADRGLAVEAHDRFPDLKIVIGGGVADPGELFELASLGISGALIGTALHNGRICSEDIRRCNRQAVRKTS